MIQLRDFGIGYGPDRLLLSGVNTDIQAGELTALVGRNGSGKSTLLRAVAGLNRNYTGVINIDVPGPMSRRLAFVNTQRVRIPGMSCADVVALGRAPYTDWSGRLSLADKDAVAHALSLTGMSQYAHRTMDRMSDGECQRIMIARALAQGTPIILLDEPTSFLDMPARYELCALLRKLTEEQGKCIVFSTHELDIALRMCRRVMLIDSPRLHNMPADAMAASGLIARLFNNPAMCFDSLSETLSKT